MKKTVFRGAGVAIITPFTETGINYPELGRIIEDQIAGGTDAIIITGTTGESATMTDAEHREAIRFAVEQVRGRIPVVAGTGSNETSYAIELSKYAEQVGADALLLVTPYYNKCTQNGLVVYYTAIADSVNIPVILYNVPSRTGVTIKTETYAALAKHPRIVAVKEASGDLSAILRLRAAVGDELAVAVVIDALVVVQQATALADHFQKTATGVEVFFVGVEVFLQVKDARGEQGDLYFGRAAVPFFALVFFDDFAFVFSGKHVCLQLSFTLPMALGL